MAIYQLIRKQFINASLGEIWNFISSPDNLRKITPPYMGFEITSQNLPDKIYPGMIITYKVRPLLGIPITWVTEISQVLDKKYFIDEQRMGPYAFWHHQHILEEQSNGVLMIDIVTYKPPFKFLGTIANFLFIRRQLEEIFNYREKKISELFSNSTS